MSNNMASSKHTLYLSPDANKILVVQLDNNGNNNNKINVVQTIEPVVEKFVGLSKEGTPFGIATEWIVRHPRHNNLIFALTSAWNEHPAVLTTFRILTDDDGDGKLEKLGSCETGGHQACHAIFSKNGNSLVVAHYNDGKVSFFDTTEPEKAPTKPTLVMDPPVLEGNERNPTQGNTMATLRGGCPSIHGITYSPNGNILLTCDPHQGCVSSFAVDENGMPLTSEEPICILHCKEPDVPLQTLAKWIGFPTRPRRANFHPNGKYVVVLHEVKNVLQVYAISEDGKIDSTCLQEISVIERHARGLALGAAAELEVTEEGVLVSNRGEVPLSTWLGSAESSVARFVWEEDDGTLLLKKAKSTSTSGPIRHFLRSTKDQSKVFVATAHPKIHVLSTLEKTSSGDLCQTSQVDLPASVFCIAE